MDYAIRRDTAELDSTGYIEVGPGRYTGKHWQPGFLFIWEDAFAMAEGIVSRHLPDYDHFGINDIPEAVGRSIIREWRDAAGLVTSESEDARQLLNLEASFRTGFEAELASHRDEVATMLRELATECDGFYSSSGWICILGM